MNERLTCFTMELIVPIYQMKTKIVCPFASIFDITLQIIISGRKMMEDNDNFFPLFLFFFCHFFS